MRPLLLTIVLASSLSAADFPTAQSPWKDADLTARGPAFQKEIEQLMSLPVEQVKPHPAAADFPGSVSAAAKPVSRKVTIDTAVPGWHSTGLYAAPGSRITVTTPAALNNGKFQVRIGSHSDKLWKVASRKWTRVPEITRTFPIAGPKTLASNAFGGLIYVVVPFQGAGKPQKVDVTIDGGVPAPYFALGQTDPAMWAKSIRNAPAPWAELQCGGVILTVPSEDIRKLDDPRKVLEFWQKVLDAEDALSAVNDRRRPERITFDRQISAGYMHSGYPIMCPLKTAADAVSLTEMKKGTWGFYHELGHNHQQGAWTFEGTGEVTCNLFSLYCFEKVCGLPRRGHGAMADDKREPRMRKYLESGTYEDWKKDPFLALTMYDQLIEAFGWEPFTKVFTEYRDMKMNERPKDDQKKRDEWMARFSRAVGKNLGPFFEAWKVPTTQAARDSIKNLPAWMPADLTPRRK